MIISIHDFRLYLLYIILFEWDGNFSHWNLDFITLSLLKLIYWFPSNHRQMYWSDNNKHHSQFYCESVSICVCVWLLWRGGEWHLIFSKLHKCLIISENNDSKTHNNPFAFRLENYENCARRIQLYWRSFRDRRLFRLLINTLRSAVSHARSNRILCAKWINAASKRQKTIYLHLINEPFEAHDHTGEIRTSVRDVIDCWKFK